MELFDKTKHINDTIIKCINSLNELSENISKANIVNSDLIIMNKTIKTYIPYELQRKLFDSHKDVIKTIENKLAVQCDHNFVNSYTGYEHTEYECSLCGIDDITYHNNKFYKSK